MARKITTGAVGGANGGVNITNTVISAASGLDIELSPAGVGRVLFNANAQLQAQSDLRFADADSSNWVGFHAPATITADVLWTLPATDGTNGQVLTTNATGTLSWSSKSVALTDQTASATTHYPLFTTASSGDVSSVNVSTTKMTYQPSTGTLTATILSTPTLSVTAGTFTGVLTASGGTSGIIGYTVQTATGSLADADRLYIVANSAAITLTLPATTTNGRTIVLADGASFGTNNVTVARNGNTIGLLAENLVLNLAGSRVELVYYSGDWKLFIL
jgi:hypothetical protein